MRNDWVKNIRGDLDLTQEQFAKALKVSIDCVQAWDQDLRRPSRRMVTRINRLKRKGEV